MIRSLVLAAVLLAAPVVAPGAAFAQDSQLPPASAAPSAATPPTSTGPGGQAMTPEMRAARQAMMQACQADFAKFCADAQAGGGGRMQCIRAHASELSDGCKSAMASMRSARPAGAAGQR